MIAKWAEKAPIHYPELTTECMPESDLHRDWMFRVIELLSLFFSGRRVYVSGNIFIYYLEGNPYSSVAPDVFVVKNCEPRKRRIFKIWEEKRTPSFAMEMTSQSSQRQDIDEKMKLYERLRVPEVFLFDPLGEWLEPRLIGYRLVRGEYQLIRSRNGVASIQLGITFRLEGDQLALFETATGRRLQTGLEQAAAAREQAAVAQDQTAQAHAEIARLRKENERLRAKTERRRK